MVGGRWGASNAQFADPHGEAKLYKRSSNRGLGSHAASRNDLVGGPLIELTEQLQWLEAEQLQGRWPEGCKGPWPEECKEPNIHDGLEGRWRI